MINYILENKIRKVIFLNIKNIDEYNRKFYVWLGCTEPVTIDDDECLIEDKTIYIDDVDKQITKSMIQYHFYFYPT